MEWVAISFSGDLPDLGTEPASCTGRRILVPPGKVGGCVWVCMGFFSD